MIKAHYDEGIRRFTMGAVVRNNASWRNVVDDIPGHVIGFNINTNYEVVVEVKWANGTTRNCHPANLELM